jgi:hypothetical protein
MSTRFSKIPIIAWAIDEFQELKSICMNAGFDFNNYVENYRTRVYETKLRNLLDASPFNFNLGGSTTKSKLVATDKPIGVFNFSLASNTLYALQEFYSFELAQADPNRFADIGLISGLVPNDLVDSMVLNGQRKFLFRDKKNNNKEYYCEKRKKGTTEIDEGVVGAKLKYASKTKKVYQTYLKKGGKVKYVEIYSLFYYAAVSTDFQYAVRHFPAMMVAEYLESVGIKTRIYKTRFCNIQSKVTL